MFLLSSGALFLCVYRARDSIDRWIFTQAARYRSRATPDEEAALPWIQHLMRNARAGNTLTHGLQSFAAAHQQHPYTLESHKILNSEFSPNALTQFVMESIRSGTPILQPCRFFHRRLEQRMRSNRRARALTAQARLQAIVVFLAPWGLLATLSVSEPEMAEQAFRDPLCLTVWSLALAMSTIGFVWIQRILHSALRPKAEEDRLVEEALPQLLLHTFARISSGSPVEDAARNSVPEEAPPLFKKIFSHIFSTEHIVAPLPLLEAQETLRSAALQGTPLKEEIERLLEDCESRRESRMEEALQKLPIHILAPLFACILPAALLILFSFLFPVFNQWI